MKWIVSQKTFDKLREPRTDQASQDLLVACVSFLFLLLAAVANTAFRLS